MGKLRRFFGKSGIKSVSLVLVLSFMVVIAGCSGDAGDKDTAEKPVLVMADVSWDSIKVHNRIAAFIIEHGYGYPGPEYQFCETLPALQGLSHGDIDIYMEVWTDNILDAWDKVLDDGTVKNLGSNFPDAPQGWYVPTYMIEGDSERGIEPMTPDLKSVSDLPQYWELFKDPEVPTKGRLHNSIPGWKCTEINEYKHKAYGLDDTYNLFSTGSDAALSASMAAAYEKGEPWLGYYWEPTWVMGKLDMTLLEEPEYDDTLWNEEAGYACAYPSAKVFIGINSELENTAPELVEFLDKYNTTLEHNNGFLAYMMEAEADEEEAALYFLKEYPDVWSSWVPEDVVEKVEAALNEVK
jgi:glycine betaine/proline transport system substrate-binding protein